MKFAVIGGDMRLGKLAELLAADGRETTVFALDKLRFPDTIRQAKTLRQAAEGADCVVLPLPASIRDGALNTPLSGDSHSLAAVFEAISPGQPVCAGRVTEEMRELAAVRHVELIDYFAREELTVANAAATAEGAVQILMEELPVTLTGAKCLVIGFGRIGKLLAHRLRACCAEVTVSARSHADRAWIRACGYTPEDTTRLDGRLSGYDAVINTVPARVLGEDRLRELAPGCLALDLASRPGGMDFAAAAALGVKAVWALSLPGEVAPESAGAAIRDTVYHILQERGVL